MPKNCDTCKYDLFRLCGEEDKTPCDDCYNGNPPTKWEPGENYEPKTNADRIRAMSDEELAEDYCKFLNAMLSKVVFKYKLDFEYDMEKGKSIMLKYLQQPAEGE